MIYHGSKKEDKHRTNLTWPYLDDDREDVDEHREWGDPDRELPLCLVGVWLHLPTCIYKYNDVFHNMELDEGKDYNYIFNTPYNAFSQHDNEVA